MSYTIISSAAGVGFVAGALLFAKAVAARGGDLVTAAALIVTGGFMVNFFGYAESYSLLYACMMLYLASAVQALRSRWPVYPATVLCACCLLLHQTAVLLTPSLAYLCFARFRDDKKWLVQFGKQAAIGAAVVGVVAFLFVGMGFDVRDYLSMLKERSAEDGSLFLTPWGGKYPILSSYHLMDFLNLLLLSSPVAFALAPLVVARRGIMHDKPALFLTAAFVPYACFYFLMDPKIEMYRDWDLFSGIGVTAAGLAAYGAAAVPTLRLPSLTKALLIGLVGLNTISWVLVNHNAAASADRFAALVDRPNRRPRPYLISHNYQQLSEFHGERGDKTRQREFLRKAAEIGQHPRRFYALGVTYARMGMLDSAAYAFEQTVHYDKKFFEAYLNLGSIYFNEGKYAEAAQRLASAAQLRPDHRQTHELRGRCLYNLGELTEAEKEYQAALALNPRDANSYGALAMIRMRQNDFAAALGYYESAVKNGLPPDQETLAQLRRKAGK